MGDYAEWQRTRIDFAKRIIQRLTKPQFASLVRELEADIKRCQAKLQELEQSDV
jgi:hypothetical protein